MRPALFEIQNDFANYYAPARAVARGESGRLARLYERDSFQLEVRRAGIPRIGSFVPHPPANALLLLPLGRLEPAAAKAVFALALAAAYLAALPVLRALTGLPLATVALLLLLPTSSLANALAYGQPYPLLLSLLALSLLLLTRGRDFAGGLALAPVLALKLYAAPHVLFLLLAARWRALFGVAAGVAAILGASLLALGLEPHLVYLREVLAGSIGGRIQDPYSPLWGSIASLAHRLFVREPDLNPWPLLDAPALVAPVRTTASVFLVLLALVGRFCGDEAAVLRQRWAALTLAALAASPLTQSYHFVLLVLPAALILGDTRAASRTLAVLALLGAATSPLPHYLLGLAHGWGNLLAYPRLVLVIALLLMSLRGALGSKAVLACGAVALGFGLLSIRTPIEPAWQRIPEARGYLAAEPVECEGALAWVGIEADRYVVRASDGRVLGGNGDRVAPRCVDGRLRTFSLDASTPEDALDSEDVDRDARGLVRAERPAGGLMVEDSSGERRPLAAGRFRRPRLSPDGNSIVAESWEDGSWDVRLFDRANGTSRRLTSAPSNELEPSWSADGRGVLFASDWRRGLGSTALYRLELR